MHTDRRAKVGNPGSGYNVTEVTEVTPGIVMKLH